MQSVTTSRSTPQDRDVVSAIAAGWRKAMEFTLSFRRISDRRQPTSTALRDAPDRPWYDDPGAARGF
jgi:hypothetical protein